MLALSDVPVVCQSLVNSTTQMNKILPSAYLAKYVPLPRVDHPGSIKLRARGVTASNCSRLLVHAILDELEFLKYIIKDTYKV